MSRRWVVTAVLLVLWLAAVAARAEQITGRRWTVGSGEAAIPVIEVWGTPYQMGYAHGRLVRGELKQYWGAFFDLVLGIMKVTPQQVDEAWTTMSPYISADLKEEMQGLADGADVPLRWVHWQHVIPDLSWLPPLHYSCSYYAAWGKAVRDGHLYQIRALDYWRDAKVQDKPAIIFFRPAKGYAFATAGWIGMIGAASGFNEQGVAISEIGDMFGPEHERMDAEPWIFMIRRALQYGGNLEQAVGIIERARRMSSYDFLIGDGRARRAVQLNTAVDIFRRYGWDKSPSKNAPVLRDVVYCSMGVDDAYNPRFHAKLKAGYGRLDDTFARDIMRTIETGDLHAVIWDATALRMWVANADATRPAYSRPYALFDLAAALRRPAR